MSTQIYDKLTDELKRAYTAVLLQIVHNLEKDQQEELRFFYASTGRIPRETSGMLNILQSLENSGIISWRDVSSLRDALIVIERLDLEKSLAAYEIKRDITILFYIYASMRQYSETCYSREFYSVESIAGYLVKITTELVRDTFDKQHLTSLMKSKKTVGNVLIDFEKAIEHKSWDPWSELTFLVVIAGEIVTEVLTNEEHRRKPEAKKLCLGAAEELCSRMMKLGSWENFSDHVEERHNAVYHQKGSVCDATGSCVEENEVIAEVVQKLADTEFFCSYNHQTVV